MGLSQGGEGAWGYCRRYCTGAPGRGQSSQQTVTFSSRLSCNTFSGKRKKVEAFVFKAFPPDKTEEGLAGLCGAGTRRGPADFSWTGEAAVVFVRLAAHAAWSLCVRVKPRAHRRAPWASAGGEMNHPPPQLANSKQIKLSLVPAQLFHGALWGTAAFGESKRICGVLRERVGAGPRGHCSDMTPWHVEGAAVTYF